MGGARAAPDPAGHRVTGEGAEHRCGQVRRRGPVLLAVDLLQQVGGPGQLAGHRPAEEASERAARLAVAPRAVQRAHAVVQEGERGLAVAAQVRIRWSIPALDHVAQGGLDVHPGSRGSLQDRVGEAEHLLVRSGLPQRKQEVGQGQHVARERVADACSDGLDAVLQEPLRQQGLGLQLPRAGAIRPCGQVRLELNQRAIWLARAHGQLGEHLPCIGLQLGIRARARQAVGHVPDRGLVLPQGRVRSAAYPQHTGHRTHASQDRIGHVHRREWPACPQGLA